VAAGETAGGLDHDVDIQLAPGQLGGIRFGQHLDGITVDHECAIGHRHFAGETAVGGVVLGQMGIGFGAAQIIYRDHTDFVRAAVFVDRPQHVAANASVTVDSNIYSHFQSPFSVIH